MSYIFIAVERKSFLVVQMLKVIHFVVRKEMDENKHDRLCNNNNNTFHLKIVLKSRALRPSDI
jgi:hypothetical protein